MNDAIHTVATSALQPGARLAAAVLDASGRVLLPEGAVLDEVAIGGLRRRGVAEVRVVVPDATDAEAYRRALAERLAILFRHAGESEAAAQLRRVVLDHRTERRHG